MEFKPGDRVIHLESGDTATVVRSEGGRSHVLWDDDQPPEDFGGSIVDNELLRRASGDPQSD
jgi:hypothetical protein